MERRGIRTQYQEHSIHGTFNGAQAGFFRMNSDKLIRHVLRAADKDLVFTTPFNQINEHTLLDGSKAVGMDNISKKIFKENLEENIQQLLMELRTGWYRPLPRKEIQIPKANGETRPIAIACFHDKVVESTVAKILSTL